ncbi:MULTISPECIES: thiosulfate sulfurtransferase GlpE [Alteromonas]|jgi:thiosulfate sulfurtransferase|uniref:Thiosulfate sulfurtransferase GlpE n=1 Tax=Alteromonas genovensis TaxID=471225 RepID=A0A6N9TJA3_9ALTE|nr:MULTISPECIES: thiosulfate sulfurtransferase GlpE [Alteromonas]MAI37511.1 thiosulfate sulfurtransferase GlpE [Alteromonas sp.]NDW17210.1 thiosulfate sulfurtransferase GlpE [Alteromonas genovensis]OUX87698.1 MAG: thiosulfate sulfurtransferase [Alteromonas sp. TMED35]|tara:strand:+ start:10992 stop:11303 length:312 start_codon:yes stop_codon:yes gene_type:complete
MSTFSHISVQDVADFSGTVSIVDIRDPQSYANGHMPNAAPLNNDNFATFVEQTPKDTPVVVVCYHGVSSQQAAQVIAQQGFETVYSMDGGFEAWRLANPVETE